MMLIFLIASLSEFNPVLFDLIRSSVRSSLVFHQSALVLSSAGRPPPENPETEPIPKAAQVDEVSK